MPDKKPIEIPADILAKYDDQEGQFEAFDGAFRTFIAAPSSSVPPIEDEPKRPRGRPKKEEV